MAVIYKDIDQLSQKPAVAGTEKIPVSDTQYLTPAQIATSKQVHLASESQMPASPDSNTLYLINDDGSGTYTLPIASESTLGGVKVGSSLSINSTTGEMNVDSSFPKYVLLANEAAYSALSTKDSGTLYLIPKA